MNDKTENYGDFIYPIFILIKNDMIKNLINNEDINNRNENW